MSFGPYLITRTLLTIPMILILSTLVFLLLRVMPGDPCLAIHGGHSTKAVLESCREKAGLNQPLPLQYVTFLAGICCRGHVDGSFPYLHWEPLDFGISFRSNRPVRTEILSKLPATLELASTAMLIAIVIGLGTGIWGAVRRDHLIDHGMRIFNIAAFAIPIFWLGLMLQIVFGVLFNHWFGWGLPIGGRLDNISALTLRDQCNTLGFCTGFYLIDSVLVGNWTALVNVLVHLLLPSMTLGLVISGIIGRISRTNMLEVLDKEYVTTARSKGLEERWVVISHALRNALVPIVTVIGLQFAVLLGGAVLTETVFTWDGLASYLIRAIGARDYNAIQGFVVFFAIFVSTVNLVVDLLYSRLDPRVRY